MKKKATMEKKLVAHAQAPRAAAARHRSRLAASRGPRVARRSGVALGVALDVALGVALDFAHQRTITPTAHASDGGRTCSRTADPICGRVRSL